MISDELKTKILRYYYVEQWRIGTIARFLAIHHSVVRRVLSESGVSLSKQAKRESKLDPYMLFITDTLAKYPKLCASRLYDMVRERGYTGGPDHFRHSIALLRPKPAAEAYLRLRALPAENAQIDWGHFGYMTIGKAKRPLMAFVMVLSYSRKIFLRFYLNQQMANFMRGHEAAFEEWRALKSMGHPEILFTKQACCTNTQNNRPITEYYYELTYLFYQNGSAWC